MRPLLLHLISDSTGETVASVARACLVQFEGVETTLRQWNMIRTLPQLEQAMSHIRAEPGLVLFTLVDPELRRQLQDACWAQQIPCAAVLDPVLNAMAAHLGAESRSQPGRQHRMDEEYFRRIEAMEYTLAHDDGQSGWDLNDADVVLLGVSRTSKTPTCMYLANRGYKAANIPLVPGVDLPEEVSRLTKPLIVGLTNTPQKLVEIRQTRLRELHEERSTGYTDTIEVEEEVRRARRLFSQHGWPVIDVSRRAIEETAAEIMTLLQQKQRESAS